MEVNVIFQEHNTNRKTKGYKLYWERKVHFLRNVLEMKEIQILEALVCMAL